MVYVPACLRANMPKVCQLLIFTCQRANKRTNVSIFQLGVPRRANVLTWRANMPNEVPIFKLDVRTSQKGYQFFRHSSYEMLSEISIVYYYIKNSTFYYILLHSRNSTFYHSYTYQMYVYVS